MSTSEIFTAPAAPTFSLGALRAGIAAWRRRRAAYLTTLRELECLSDRELADVGLSRASFRQIAREAAAAI